MLIDDEITEAIGRLFAIHLIGLVGPPEVQGTPIGAGAPRALPPGPALETAQRGPSVVDWRRAARNRS